jgi:hypothetical protein
MNNAFHSASSCVSVLQMKVSNTKRSSQSRQLFSSFTITLLFSSATGTLGGAEMQASTSASPSVGGDDGLWGRAKEGLPAPTSTPIGGRSFASPAMIRILLTPAHPNVTPDEFEMMAGVIRRFDTIRLSDLPKSQSRGETVGESLYLERNGMNPSNSIYSFFFYST